LDLCGFEASTDWAWMLRTRLSGSSARGDPVATFARS
jgi:hypothetical protein